MDGQGGGGGPSARRSMSLSSGPGRRRLSETPDFDSPRRPSSSRAGYEFGYSFNILICVDVSGITLRV